MLYIPKVVEHLVIEKIRKAFLECSSYRINYCWKRYKKKHSKLNNRAKHQILSTVSLIQDTVD